MVNAIKNNVILGKNIFNLSCYLSLALQAPGDAKVLNISFRGNCMLSQLLAVMK